VPAPPTNVSLAPNSGSGASQTFTATYGDISGYQDITSAFLLINSGYNAQSSCYVQWSAAGFFLLNDSAAAWLGPIGAGTNATLQNSQCVLNGSSTANGSGNNRVVNCAITFLSAFAGPKILYPFAIDPAGTSPNNPLGTWTVPVPITFQSNPPGRSIKVDTTTCTSTCTLQLIPGVHTLDASIAQNPPPARSTIS